MGNVKVGRPKKVKLVTIDKAIALVREYYLRKGVGEDDLSNLTPARQTIYNKISKKLLRNLGDIRCVLLDEDEVIEKLCS